jgi:hypothetical protein
MAIGETAELRARKKNEREKRKIRGVKGSR